MGLTTDRADACLGEIEPSGMQKCYLVLSDEDVAKGFVRPVRRAYVHLACGTETVMGQRIAETYAAQPHFYGGTFCVGCRAHFDLHSLDGGAFTWHFEWSEPTKESRYVGQ